MAYMWDDHDYCGNDSNRTNIGRAASRQVYRERFPHYQLPAGGPDAAIYQAFSVGRVRFILTDLRSERDPTSATDNASKSHMGAAQKAWFKQELLNARDAETPLVVWNSSVPFISTNTGGDDWGRYQTERREILEFIRDNRIQNVIVISGDMHALALDDGQGTASYVAGVRIPVFHAAALAQSGSSKGGPYRVGAASITPNQGAGRYGLIDITDTGSTVTAVYRGRIASGSGSTWSSTSDWTFTGSQSSFTFTAEAVRPRSVTGLAAAPAATGGVLLAWADNSGVETGQRLERKLSSESVFSTIANLPANQTSYLDSTIPDGATAEYRVIAVHTAIESDPSPVAAATAYTALQKWKAQNYGDAETSDAGDPNGNGVSTLLEYAFNLNVANGSTLGMPEVVSIPQPEGERLVIRFVRERAELVYRVQATNDFVTWQDLVDNPGTVGSLVEWLDTTAPAPARFLRVTVIR
jgi:hypothetical protein